MRADLCTPRAPFVLVASLLALSLGLPAAGGAGSASSLHRHAAQLRQRNAVLAARSHGAVLTIYALDTRLTQSRSDLSSLDRERASLERDQIVIDGRLRIAGHVLRAAEHNLETRLRDLYEQGDTDALAVLLGAKSLDDGLSSLEALNLSASADRNVLAEARASRAAYRALEGKLDARRHELARLEARARATAAALAAARSARAAYVTQLAASARLNRGQIASLESQARSVEVRAQELAAAAATRTAAPTEPPPAAPTPSAPPPGAGAGARTLTVSATGYSIRGRTATGAPTGYGVVAVDPSVIPLGTRMTIPGYGEGVAADTGGAIRGTAIDLWFPTAAQAAAWGRRSVTITLH